MITIPTRPRDHQRRQYLTADARSARQTLHRLADQHRRFSDFQAARFLTEAGSSQFDLIDFYFTYGRLPDLLNRYRSDSFTSPVIGLKVVYKGTARAPLASRPWLRACSPRDTVKNTRRASPPATPLHRNEEPNDWA